MPNVTTATNITTTGSGTPTVFDICTDILSIPFIIVISVLITVLKAFIQSR